MNNTKPKTALLYLLEKCDAIREELGAEECEEVASALRTEWKRLRKEYTSTAPSNKRASSAPNQTNIDDDASSTRGSGSNIDTRVSEQDAYIISLQTRLKLLQGIIEDIVKPGLSDAEKLQAVVSRTLFFTDVETSEDDSA
jgi:hypothetical protein